MGCHQHRCWMVCRMHVGPPPTTQWRREDSTFGRWFSNTFGGRSPKKRVKRASWS
jgi:hypothetical protein